MTEYELTSPFLTVSFKARLERWQFVGLLVAWLALWAAVAVVLLYLYAVTFAGWVGFETAALVGIGIIAMGVGSK